MKKLIAILICALAVASCDLFKLDNFDGPNAQIHGRFLDIKTGDLMGVEVSFNQDVDWNNVDWVNWVFPVTTVAKGTLIVNELGWKDNDGNEVTEDQRWFVRFDGRYRNNLVFAADYRVLMKELPCYELDDNEITVKEGDNTHDFTVTPFCRIIDPEVTYNAATQKFVATFKVELGDPTKANVVKNVMFCANTQLFVGTTSFNLAKDDAGAHKQNITPGDLVTLEIDTQNAKNADLFKYNRVRYFRIAAEAEGNDYNGKTLYNFSPTYKVSADYQTIEEYHWSE